MSATPLLNEYKRDFVLKRIPQTFLGGPNLYLGYSAPCYVHLAQIIIWFLPWIIGGIFTLTTELGGLTFIYGSILTGVLMILFILAIQAVHVKRKVQRNSQPDGRLDSLTASQQCRHLLAEDDEIVFESFCSMTTFEFVIPPLRFSISIIFRAVFSGVLCGFGHWYTLPSVLNDLYGSSVPATVLLYIFSWITICIAQYPLNGGGIPPEVATFRSTEFYDTSALSRVFHIFIFFAFHLVEIYITSEYAVVNQVLHILFVFLPLFWLSGLFPPIDALFLWAIEQLLVFALGGSPVATDFRLFSYFILSGAVLTGACFISNISAIVLYSACFGLLLSTDIVSVIAMLIYKLYSKCRHKSKHSEGSSHFDSSLSLNAGAWHVATLAVVALVASLSVNYQARVVLAQVQVPFQIVFIAMMVVCKLLQEVQRVYVCFRIFRNCFYPQSFSSITSFNNRKKILNGCGYLHAALSCFVNPILMVFYLSVYLIPGGTATLPSFLTGLATVHAFRMVWQRSNNALLIFGILSVIDLAISSPSVSLGWFDSASMGVRLLVLDICVDRVAKFADNSWFVFALLVTSWSDKKQRRRKTSLTLIILNVLFFPVVVAIVAIATALSAPVLPLFTLPLFYIAFPRPSRFWPQTPGEAPASVCSDTSHYLQMAPEVSKVMAKGSFLGKYSSLGGQGTDLPSFIFRSQDKTFWVQILESGYGYTSFSLKGLELQETSCHALEATRLDEAFDSAFEKPDEDDCLRVNPYSFLYGVTPLDTVYIEGFSDAKNSLSGIIDYPEAIKQAHPDFLKCLTWLLVPYLCKERQQGCDDIPELKSNSEKKKKKSDNFIPPTSILPSAHPKRGLPVVAFKPKASASLISLDEVLSSRPNSNTKAFEAVAKSKPDSSPSLGSLGSILASDEDFLGQKKNGILQSEKKTKPPTAISPKPPGAIESDDDIWELDSEFSDSGFGLPLDDIQQKKSKTDASTSFINRPGALITTWGDIPVPESDYEAYKKLFDRSWYLHVTSSLEDASASGWEEDELMITTRKLALACYFIIFVQGMPGRDASLVGPSHLCKIFADDVPWSPDLEWLRQRKDLYKIVLQAHRYSMKMMYDRVIMGAVDDASSEAYDDTITSLQEYDCDWFIGMETSPEWKEAVKVGKSSLFSLNLDKSKNEYTARILIRRPIETHVARLSSAAIRSIWANLSLELLYATNDDEERYSIQAQQDLLRNLTVQAADPPLGYPIFSSQPRYERTLPLL